MKDRRGGYGVRHSLAKAFGIIHDNGESQPNPEEQCIISKILLAHDASRKVSTDGSANKQTPETSSLPDQDTATSKDAKPDIGTSSAQINNAQAPTSCHSNSNPQQAAPPLVLEGNSAAAKTEGELTETQAPVPPQTEVVATVIEGCAKSSCETDVSSTYFLVSIF